MNKFRALFMVCFVGAAAAIAVYAAESVGNPKPGFPHDTIIVHVLSDQSGPKACDGGHSLFLQACRRESSQPTRECYITDDRLGPSWITTVTGSLDEDPDRQHRQRPRHADRRRPARARARRQRPWIATPIGDGAVRLQIRDTVPATRAEVSKQEWFMRLIGKPGQNFAFTSYANQTASCTLVADPDGILDSVATRRLTCDVRAPTADWLVLASVQPARPRGA